MKDDLTAADIKRIRGKYGLTQQAFARVLGIGEATIARYENGASPTRSMANLIRAAEDPSFMRSCLERDGERIPKAQRDSAEKITYAEIVFDEKGEVASMNEIYELTLQQEILNEQAAEMLADLHRMRRAAEAKGDTPLAMLYDDVAKHIALAKHSILDTENDSTEKIAVVRGRIEGLMHFALAEQAKAA